MMAKKYMEAFWGYFDGYDAKGKAVYKPVGRSKEFIQGKYRPIFGRVKLYQGKKIPANVSGIKTGMLRIPATKENIRKQLDFNIKHGSEWYQEISRKKMKKMGL
jgi:hypothetical protein